MLADPGRIVSVTCEPSGVASGGVRARYFISLDGIMPELPVDLFFVMHAAVLSIFVGATSVSMLLAVISRVRIRRPLQVWRYGRVLRIPVGPTAFLVLVTLAFGATAATGGTIEPHVLVGYPAGGVFWWVATWLYRSIVVTDYGVIHDVTCISRAVSWSQITDYFVTTGDDDWTYVVFFYQDDDGMRQRLNVPVPEHQRDAFEQLISRKLDTRFRCMMRKSYDEETLGE